MSGAPGASRPSSEPLIVDERRPGEPVRADLATTILRTVLALALVVVPAAVLVSRSDALPHGHPVYPVTLVAALVAGLLLGWRAFRLRTHVHRAPRRLRSFGAAVALVAATLLVIALGWLHPSTATAPALAAMRSDAFVEVRETVDTIAFVPADRGPGSGTDIALVFSPAQRVDARAYARMLRPLAADGNLVVVLKEPFGLSFTDPGQSRRVMDRYPAVRIWAVGGHSLGGATAATVAHAHPEVGLLLWAAATVWTIADTSLPASWSISGTRDTLAGPTDIQESRPELPANTCFVAVEGAIDGYFGDFGAQEGDGVPTVGRAAAQAQIVAATRQFRRALRSGDPSCPR